MHGLINLYHLLCGCCFCVSFPKVVLNMSLSEKDKLVCIYDNLKLCMWAVAIG